MNELSDYNSLDIPTEAQAVYLDKGVFLFLKRKNDSLRSYWETIGNIYPIIFHKNNPKIILIQDFCLEDILRTMG